MTRKTKDSQPTNERPDPVDLSRRAQQGDESALAALQSLVKRPDFWREAVDLTANAEAALITRMSAKNLVFRESVKAQLDHMKAELGGPAPSPLEKLLVDRIVILWLQVTYYETTYTQQLGELTIRQADYHQRRIDGTYRRYLAAIRSLAQVRRLAVPVLQVNVAQAGARQLNVATPGPVLGDGDSAEDGPAL